MTVVLYLSFLLSTIITTSQGISDQIHPLRPHSGASGRHIHGVNCLSWRLAVETDNLRNWMVPAACENYVGHYMIGDQYRKDCEAAANAAYEYAKSLKLATDGKDVWVFDIDETSLSNLPYFARSDVAFGAKEYNETSFAEWQKNGTAPAVPAILNLFRKLLHLGFKIVFITGKSESLREVTVKNLNSVGYLTWEKLILKQTADEGSTAVVYKSKKRKELEKKGYRILGNMGDQWSDLLGTHVGNRTFKVPDPMYYLS